MTLEGLIALVVMLVGGLVSIGLPFMTKRNTLSDTRKRELELSRDELITTYERVLSTLRDLEDDYKSHKIPPEDYEYERVYWSEYGIRVLKLLEGENVQEPDVDDSELYLDHNVEEAIQNYRVALQSVDKA